ncbi:serine hydrolase domain-containing protein [Sphingomonas sp. M1-B02]|uniref:serine hydrolase domain-containing protein n=1 Tax=Sphingomonas sp. M1-B02 TaxID=3114300 RepID=UPI0022409A33|nr:serine hydrolase domain-containing protein [Sphingomonas sp. S6-11]UZK65459.1 beta-lactamase family protein [Sphingomonas sp. S6-11]
MKVALHTRLALGALALPLLSSQLAVGPALAQARPTSIAAPRIAGLADFVDGVVAQQIATREVAGAVVTVVYQGKVLFTRGYGFADIDKGLAVDPQRTLFRPGSVSKLFTWTALMQQVELGRVSLDADVNSYLDFKIPEFGSKPIRVRDLLSHSPGMSDVGGFIFADESKLVPYGDWLKAHIPARLWDAGTEISYSNFGAALAGFIVERVSGEPFADYADKHIFRPLAMNATTFREPLPRAMRDHMATGYRFADGVFVAKPFEYLSSIMPAGSATASGPDMARFMLAMLGEGRLGGARILKPESVRLLHSNSFANAPRVNGMAHGFLVERNAGPRMIGHAGNTGDFHSDLVIVPQAGFGFFVSTTGGQKSSPARTELRDAIIGRLFPQAPAPAWAGDASPPQLGSYRGNRRDYNRTPDPKRDLIVAAAGARMLTIEAEGVKTAWRQIGPRLYEQVTGARAGGPYDQIEFYGTPKDPRLSFTSQPYATYHFVKP